MDRKDLVKRRAQPSREASPSHLRTPRGIPAMLSHRLGLSLHQARRVAAQVLALPDGEVPATRDGRRVAVVLAVLGILPFAGWMPHGLRKPVNPSWPALRERARAKALVRGAALRRPATARVDALRGNVCKLSAEQRDELRRRYNEGARMRDLARYFGVSVATAYVYAGASARRHRV